MFKYVWNYWKNNSFKVIITSAIVFILFLSLFRLNEKGSWDDSKSIQKLFLLDKEKRIRQHYYNKQKSKKNSSKGEQECRRVLENYFNKSFPNSRPAIIKNPITNYNLELDCYNSELKLAVEYNGQQHYKFNPYFHKNKDSFRVQQYKDEIKRRLCHENNIKLIEVPNTIPVDQIREFLIKELHKLGYKKHNY